MQTRPALIVDGKLMPLNWTCDNPYEQWSAPCVHGGNFTAWQVDGQWFFSLAVYPVVPVPCDSLQHAQAICHGYHRRDAFGPMSETNGLPDFVALSTVNE